MSCSSAGRARIGSAKSPGMFSSTCWMFERLELFEAVPMIAGITIISSAGTASIGMTIAFERRIAMTSLAMIARITLQLMV